MVLDSGLVSKQTSTESTVRALFLSRFYSENPVRFLSVVRLFCPVSGSSDEHGRNRTIREFGCLIRLPDIETKLWLRIERRSPEKIKREKLIEIKTKSYVTSQSAGHMWMIGNLNLHSAKWACRAGPWGPRILTRLVGFWPGWLSTQF